LKTLSQLQEFLGLNEMRKLSRLVSEAGMWKEAIVVCFKVLSCNLLGRTEKDLEKRQSRYRVANLQSADRLSTSLEATNPVSITAESEVCLKVNSGFSLQHGACQNCCSSHFANRRGPTETSQVIVCVVTRLYLRLVDWVPSHENTS
jgi:hypothetical protein